MSWRASCLGLLILLRSASMAWALEPVAARLSAEWAWTGQPVVLSIQLASPGPFRGSAAFDLPELPRTVIIKTGNPVVGSETIDDTEWITQTHDFRVFTQQVGEVRIPPIPVRFEALQGYVGEPIRYEVSTEPLSFESRRPESADPSLVVLAATSVNMIQNWQPADLQTLAVGGVVKRTVTREAQGTTAMLMVPMTTMAPEGVRVFESPPVIQDDVDRGTIVARRVDTVRYQFELPGVFELPAFEFRWWDSQRQEERVERCEGVTVTVTGQTESAAEPATSAWKGWWPTGISLLAAVSVFAGYCWLRSSMEKTRSPETRAARQVLAACAAGDAANTHARTLAWRQTVPQADTPAGAAFDEEWRRLDASLFAASPEKDDWSASRFAHAFKAYRRSLRTHTAPHREGLAPLNPTLV
ncbi:MAG: hypothetical protein AAGF97_00545 [Planctomycetota bacterium]